LVEKKSDSPDVNKSLVDSKALLPVLIDFFKKHPNEKTFLGDANFDTDAYPSVERGSKEGDEIYKIRVNVEKYIIHFKDSFCIAGRKTPNEKMLHADLLLAGIAWLATVMVADKIHQHQYLRSLKPLIA
jgi:hypothetical protein